MPKVNTEAVIPFGPECLANIIPMIGGKSRCSGPSVHYDIHYHGFIGGIGIEGPSRNFAVDDRINESNQSSGSRGRIAIE